MHPVPSIIETLSRFACIGSKAGPLHWRLGWLFAPAAALLAAGCVPEQAALQDNLATDDFVQSQPVDPPNVELTAKMLNDLVVSELGYQRGDTDRSIEMLAALATETRDYRLARTVSQRAVNAKRYDIAGHTTAMWVELTPQDSLGWWTRGVTQIAINDFDGAVESFNKTLRFAPPAGRNRLFADIARAISTHTDPELSYSMFLEVTNQYPNESTAYQILVRFAVASGERREVVDGYIDKAYEIDPSPEIAQLRFTLLLEQDRDSEAIEYIKQKVAKYPKSEVLGLTYAEHLASLGKLAEALKHLDNMSQSSALLQSASLYYRSNRLDLAREKYLEYIALEPDDQDALVDLARVEIDFGQLDSARDTLDRVLDRQLQFERTLLEAEFATASDRLDDGISLLEQVPIESPAQRIRIHIAKQNLYSIAEQWDNAISILNEAIEEFPNNTQLLLTRSFVAAEMGLVDVAEGDLTIVLAQDPDNANALNALGYTLTDLTERHDEALQLIERALAIRPHDPYILDSMGWVQYKLGNTEAALEFLERAHALRLDPVIAAHLGEIYWQTGERERARKIWERAIKIDPDDRTLQETIKKFLN